MFRVLRPVFLALLLLPFTVAGQVPPELRTADAMAARVEAAERSPALAGDMDLELEPSAVEAELDKVAAYLRAHPEDPFALVLSVRLGRIRDLLALRDAYMAKFEDPEAREPEPPSSDRHLAILEGVLARDSTVAEAHYWTARLLLEDVARRAAMAQMAEPPAALQDVANRRALAHARLAVTFAPGRIDHREFLALLLVLEGNPVEAAELLGHGSTSGKLMHRLALDLVAFAPPKPAVDDEVLRSFSQMTAMMGAGASDPALAEHLELRAHGWSTVASLEEVTGYYQGRWPGVRFFPAEAWDGSVMAAFLPKNGEWRAVVDEAELEALDEWDAEVLILVVIPPKAYEEMCQGALRQGLPREMLLPGSRVGLMLMNGRRPPSGSREQAWKR